MEEIQSPNPDPPIPEVVKVALLVWFNAPETLTNKNKCDLYDWFNVDFIDN